MVPEPFIEGLKVQIQESLKTIKTLIDKKTELNQEIRDVEEKVKHCIEILKSEGKKHGYNINIDPNLTRLINHIPVDVTSVPLPIAILYILSEAFPTSKCRHGRTVDEIYTILRIRGKIFRCKDPYNTVYVTLKNLETKNKIKKEKNKWLIIQQPSVDL